MAAKTIPLTRGFVALVDEEDYERLAQFKWHAVVEKRANGASPRIYARRCLRINGRQSHICMHKMILACSSDVDHADTNGLNNQRLNLRPASESQNQANARKMAATSSTFKGVDWNKETRKWRARVNVRGKRINIGYFKDEVDAATAYNFAAFEHFCEYALLNAPRPN